jgi:hypothetical protein
VELAPKRFRVRDVDLDQLGTRRDVRTDSGAQVVRDDDSIPAREERLAQVAADEAGTAGDEDVAHEAAASA